ncbi:MAG: type II secretion system F family protein [Candidatus Eisenbacteria bacterium]
MIFALVSLLIFAAVATLAGGMLLRRKERDTDVVKDRVGGRKAKADRSQDLTAERDTRLSSLPFLDSFLRSLSFARRLELLLYQAGSNMRVATFLLVVAAAALVGYLAGYIVFTRLLHAFVFGALGGFAPVFVLMQKKSARMRAFAEEFPDALDLLVSALRAGISFSSALQIVADESPEPVRSEFAIVVEEQALGLDLREALTNMANRVDSLDLKFFVTAVVLQRDTGGNLTEVLENTSKLIRDRFRILGDIMTFTAQGRLTGLILTCLPLGLGIFMAMVAPDYFHKMWDHSTGKAILGFAVVMQILGGLAIRKIVDIKV